MDKKRGKRDCKVTAGTEAGAAAEADMFDRYLHRDIDISSIYIDALGEETRYVRKNANVDVPSLKKGKTPIG